MGFPIRLKLGRSPKFPQLGALWTPSWTAALLEALSAVNRSTLSRFEGDLGLCTAIGAGDLMHLAWSKTPSWPA